MEHTAPDALKKALQRTLGTSQYFFVAHRAHCTPFDESSCELFAVGLRGIPNT